MREKAKATIKAALWIFIAMPAIWAVQLLIAKMVGLERPMPFSNFAVLMVVFGAWATYNIVKME